jgi:hypothetical protein
MHIACETKGTHLSQDTGVPLIIRANYVFDSSAFRWCFITQGRYKYCIFMVVFPWVRNVIDFLMMFQFLCGSKSEQCLLSLADIYVAVGDPIINCYAFPKPWLKFPTSYFVVCFSSRVDVAGVCLLCWYW